MNLDLYKNQETSWPGKQLQTSQENTITRSWLQITLQMLIKGY